MSRARKTGKLLKTTCSGGKGGCAAQLTSGLILHGTSTDMWGMEKSKRIPHFAQQQVPPSCGWGFVSPSLCYWDNWTTLNGQKKGGVSFSSSTEHRRRVYASSLKVQNNWCASEPAKPTMVLGVCQDGTWAGKRGLSTSRVTQHLLGWGHMLLLHKQLCSIPHTS